LAQDGTPTPNHRHRANQFTHRESPMAGRFSRLRLVANRRRHRQFELLIMRRVPNERSQLKAPTKKRKRERPGSI